MAIVKAVSSKATINTAIEYVTKEEKTEKKLVSGYNCQPENVAEEMQLTKEAWGKTDGRTYKHIVQSFHPDEPITPEEAHKIAQEFAEKCPQFQGFEVLIATHQDKKHIHTHFIVNSVSYEDGHKFQQSKQELKQWKELSDEILKEHGLKVVEKGKTYEGKDREETSTYTKEAHRRQKKAEAGEVKSYVQNIALAVMEERKKATSKEEFIANLQNRGIGVDWVDNHKYITFIDLERQEQGEKQCKVRDNKLAQYYNMDFSKETLINEFEGNIRKSENREQQLIGAIEQIRESDRRPEPIDKPVRNGAEARESQNREVPRTEAKLSRESFTSFGTEARASDPKPRSNRMGEFKRAMAETTNRIERASSSLERTMQQAGNSLQAIQRSMGAGEEQQDGIEEELRAEQQLLETISSAVFDITAELERFGKEIDRAEAEQRTKREQYKQPDYFDTYEAIAGNRELAEKLGEKASGVGTEQREVDQKQRGINEEQQSQRAGTSGASAKAEGVGRDQRDIKGKQRELGGKQSSIIDRIGELGDRVRELAEQLKEAITRPFRRGGR